MTTRGRSTTRRLFTVFGALNRSPSCDCSRVSRTESEHRFQLPEVPVDAARQFHIDAAYAILDIADLTSINTWMTDVSLKSVEPNRKALEFSAPTRFIANLLNAQLIANLNELFDVRFRFTVKINSDDKDTPPSISEIISGMFTPPCAFESSSLMHFAKSGW